MSTSFTQLQPTLGIAHGDLRFVCGCLTRETHFMKITTNSSCADVASRGSLQPRTDDFYSTTALGHPVLWACVAYHFTAIVSLRRFHFTITTLTVDRGSSSRADIWQNWLVGKGASNDSATLKVTKIFSEAILLPMFIYRDCMAVCTILYTWQQWVWLK